MMSSFTHEEPRQRKLKNMPKVTLSSKGQVRFKPGSRAQAYNNFPNLHLLSFVNYLLVKVSNITLFQRKKPANLWLQSLPKKYTWQSLTHRSDQACPMALEHSRALPGYSHNQSLQELSTQVKNRFTGKVENSWSILSLTSKNYIYAIPYTLYLSLCL